MSMPPNTKSTPEAQISAPALLIEHVITENFLDDQPWPPPAPGLWALVCPRPADGTTVWRRIIQPKI